MADSVYAFTRLYVAWSVMILSGATATGLYAQGDDRPNVAILIYEGVQIIDHAAPWEVLGQYGLNNVFTVAKDTLPVSTFMGMRVLPSYRFGDHPLPDVVVIPGGDAGAAQRDPEILEWIRHNVASSDYVLGICSGVAILAAAEVLSNRRVTTFYDLLDDLALRHPDVEVVEDELVVEDGKFITTTGTGIEGALRIGALLHGGAWARVVALNMEFEAIPSSQRTPRARLADMNLPSSVYGAIPWREAQLAEYRGDEASWIMTWRFAGTELGSLAETLRQGLEEEGWRLASEQSGSDAWTSEWRLLGRKGMPWSGTVRLASLPNGRLELAVQVEE